MSVSKIAGQYENLQSRALPWASVYALSAAILVGVSILTVIGFASPEVLHNAAHDIRHSMIFPCH